MLGITEKSFSVAEIVRQKRNQALSIRKQASYEIQSNTSQYIFPAWRHKH